MYHLYIFLDYSSKLHQLVNRKPTLNSLRVKHNVKYIKEIRESEDGKRFEFFNASQDLMGFFELNNSENK